MERNRSWYSIVAGKTTLHESLPEVQLFWACVLLLVAAIKPSNRVCMHVANETTED
jgi:tryptophan-rich sensory protein